MGKTTDALHDDAITRHQAYLKADPNNAVLLLKLGDMYHRAGRFDEALSNLDRCLAQQPQHAVARSRRAGVLISLHRFSDAEQELRGVLRQAPADPAVLHNLGVALFYQQRWQEAFDAFQQSRQSGLDDGGTLAYLTYCLHHLGDFAGATATCHEWLARDPSGSAEAYLALLEMDDGNLAAAHQRAQAVLARQPENIDALLVEAMWLTEQQDVDTAREHFERVVQKQPDNGRGWLGVGLADLYQERNAAALEALKTACNNMPGHVGALTTLGWGYFVSRDLAAAEQTFRAAIAMDRSFGEAHGGLAITLVYLKRYHEARRETRIALRLNPRGFGAVYAQGALLAIDGKRPQGEAVVAAALMRPVMADGRLLIEHVQAYLRRQLARPAAPEQKAPPQ